VLAAHAAQAVVRDAAAGCAAYEGRWAQRLGGGYARSVSACWRKWQRGWDREREKTGTREWDGEKTEVMGRGGLG
jgi:hypothetical protein